MSLHDPINAPSHYRGRSGREAIEITHAYRLGPDLTQAVDYILRAGRKTPDPRQDLAKAAFYLRYAANSGRDLSFGFPESLQQSAAQVAADFDLDANRAKALEWILKPWPMPSEAAIAATCVEAAIEAYTVAALPVANTGRAA